MGTNDWAHGSRDENMTHAIMVRAMMVVPRRRFELTAGCVIIALWDILVRVIISLIGCVFLLSKICMLCARSSELMGWLERRRRRVDDEDLRKNWGAAKSGLSVCRYRILRTQRRKRWKIDQCKSFTPFSPPWWTVVARNNKHATAPQIKERITPYEQTVYDLTVPSYWH